MDLANWSSETLCCTCILTSSFRLFRNSRVCRFNSVKFTRSFNMLPKISGEFWSFRVFCIFALMYHSESLRISSYSHIHPQQWPMPYTHSSETKLAIPAENSAPPDANSDLNFNFRFHSPISKDLPTNMLFHLAFLKTTGLQTLEIRTSAQQRVLAPPPSHFNLAFMSVVCALLIMQWKCFSSSRVSIHYQF